jgi:pectate lyase
MAALGPKYRRSIGAALAAAAALTTLGTAECARSGDAEPAGAVRKVATEEPGGTVAAQESAIPVFPGAEGFGTRTRAGRGGKVVAVTSLADDGPGSLREALDDAAPKTIVFRVGGVIRLKSHLFVSHPFVTIAGQTAPGDGILIRDFGLVIVTNDVLIQSIRVRPGNEGAVRPDHNDAIAILGPQDDSSGARNVVIDHVSVSWGEDELISTWFGPSDITVSWSIIGEGLNRSRHDKGTHSAGLIVANNSNHVSVHHNLFAHNDFRNPLVMSGGSHDVVNNVVYDWGTLPTEIVDDAPMSVNVVGNYYRSGPSTKTEHVILINGDDSRIIPKIFAAGNVRHGASEPENGWSLVQYGWKGAGAPDRYRAAARFALPLVTTQSAADAFSIVLDTAGAMWPKRDAVDGRLVADVRRGSGAIIDDPKEVGGFPAYATSRGPADSDRDGLPDEWERREGLDPNDPADGNADRDGDGYTNLEAYLHALMRAQ